MIQRMVNHDGRDPALPLWLFGALLIVVLPTSSSRSHMNLAARSTMVCWRGHTGAA